MRHDWMDIRLGDLLPRFVRVFFEEKRKAHETKQEESDHAVMCRKHDAERVTELHYKVLLGRNNDDATTIDADQKSFDNAPWEIEVASPLEVINKQFATHKCDLVFLHLYGSPLPFDYEAFRRENDCFAMFSRSQFPQYSWLHKVQYPPKTLAQECVESLDTK